MLQQKPQGEELIRLNRLLLEDAYPQKIAGEKLYGWWWSKTEEVLSRDYLSPTVASGLYAETAQCVIPFPVAGFDRARALEYGLEEAWDKAFDGKRPSDDEATDSTYNPFRESLHEIGQNNVRQAVPALFLNTTRVETGDRLALNSIEASEEQDFQKNLRTLSDENPHLAFYLPLSAAAFLSARFPYISPSGSLPIFGKQPRRPFRPLGYKRCVDGGYFENSGAATIVDIVECLNRCRLKFEGQPEIARELRGMKFRLCVICLNFGYESDKAAQPPAEPLTGFDEPLSPILAYMHTRDARGRTALVRLASEMGLSRKSDGACDSSDDGWRDDGQKDLLFEKRFKQRKVALPVSWLLSAEARNDFVEQVEKEVLPSIHREWSGVWFGGNRPPNRPVLLAQSPEIESTPAAPGAARIGSVPAAKAMRAKEFPRVRRSPERAAKAKQAKKFRLTRRRMTRPVPVPTFEASANSAVSPDSAASPADSEIRFYQ